MHVRECVKGIFTGENCQEMIFAWDIFLCGQDQHELSLFRQCNGAAWESVWSVDSACSACVETSAPATQRGRGQLHPVTDTVGTVRPGNVLWATAGQLQMQYVTANRLWKLHMMPCYCVLFCFSFVALKTEHVKLFTVLSYKLIVPLICSTGGE